LHIGFLVSIAKLHNLLIFLILIIADLLYYFEISIAFKYIFHKFVANYSK